MKLTYPAFAVAKANTKGKCCERRRRSRAQCLSACTGVVDYKYFSIKKSIQRLYSTDSLFQMFQLLKHISATYKSDLLKMDM